MPDMKVERGKDVWVVEGIMANLFVIYGCRYESICIYSGVALEK